MSEPSVVTLRGDRFANPAEPDANVVEATEYILDLAKNGQVTGIAYAISYYDGKGHNHFCGTVSRNTVGHLFSVATRLSNQIDSEDD